MLKNKKRCIRILFAAWILHAVSCHSPITNRPDGFMLKKARQYALARLRGSLDEVPVGRFPIRTKGLGPWELTAPSSWTSGFFPGCLWLAFRISGDSSWISHARKYTERLESQKDNTETHDIGFMMFNSYGNGWKITNDPRYRNILLQAAHSLARRYHKNVGCIQSWNGEFQVIIDNMMNLELLFWAARNGGEHRFYEIAVSHADKTIENHLRQDGSSFHVVVFDTATGKVKEKRTAQGYSAGSAWARGQAWGIYGFTMAFRETGDSTYLDTAVRMADFFIDHLPPDRIPFWDLILPKDHPKPFKDASAAAIALSGMLELRRYAAGGSSKYDAVIDQTLKTLSRRYLSEGTHSSGILLHGAYNANSANPFDWDASTIWGDYYFLEAIERHENGHSLR